MAEAIPLALSLAQFSHDVRESTIRRFRQVLPADWRWRPRSDLLTFADVLKHLVDADRWLFERLDGGSPSEGVVIAPADADHLACEPAVEQLIRCGQEKRQRISEIPERDFYERRFDLRARGEVNLMQLILRCNLDHEIHHRGALQLALRLRYG